MVMAANAGVADAGVASSSSSAGASPVRVAVRRPRYRAQQADERLAERLVREGLHVIEPYDRRRHIS